jgi:hypothetical protein
VIRGKEKRERPIVIPPVVRIVPVGIHVPTVVVPVQLEHIQVTVCIMRNTIRATTHRIVSELNFMRYL